MWMCVCVCVCVGGGGGGGGGLCPFSPPRSPTPFASRYGLTSVALSDYVCASALGMLPGTAAYVAAGHAYADALSSDSGGLHVTYWQVGAAVAASAAAGTYIARIATAALEEDLGSTDLEEELHL